MSKIGSADATYRHKPDPLSLHLWSMSRLKPASRQSWQSHALWLAIPRWPSLPRAELAMLIRVRGGGLVEPIGIEPMTPCLQSRCSPS